MVRTLATALIVLVVFTYTSGSTLPLAEDNEIGEEIKPEVKETKTTKATKPPDVPRSYCGFERHKAVRKYCREDVIKMYRNKSYQKNLQKSKCGETLQDKCCYNGNKCTIELFVEFCPYIYLNETASQKMIR